jgi:hypothetical protein
MSDWIELAMALGRLMLVLMVWRWLLAEPISIAVEFDPEGEHEHAG